MRGLLLGLCLLSGSALAFASSEQERFVIEEVLGAQAWVKRSGSEAKEALSKGNVMHVNDTLLTGDSSHIVLSLFDGSKISIGPYSEYQIQKVEKVSDFWIWSFRLVVGTVRSLVRKIQGESELTRFKIHTDTGTAGVRGTDFVVAYSAENQRMDVYTIDGRVYIGPPQAEFSHPSSSLVEKNRTRSIGMDGVPTKHRAFIRDEFLKTLKERGFPDLQLGAEIVGGPGASASVLAAGRSDEAAPGNSNSKSDENKLELSRKMIAAVIEGNTAAVVTFLKAGANANFQDESGATGLMLGAKGGHSLIIKALLGAGALPDMQDPEGNTALIYAVRWGDLQGVVLMRSARANVEVKNKEGLSASDYAQRRGDKTVIDYLSLWRKGVSDAEKNKKQRKRKK